ncbi:MAG: NAD(P)-dependent oxidoreductase [Bacteroidetes bacterium]|nr:MAG: NAD(P)-dependent oxidoreductase [Bacteroidota bacterium]REK05735.1 MAG: NAD(P)-dependent oxidoreductase [Bacteroidota bacterium]REK31959.1 MAG: NAD(P)-dependent oxidoreductase [Bacteroidota bacterium]REK50024.1 MAG: NAD(P)-dependent oxidoreductase [Bacteroidota bacterium]
MSDYKKPSSEKEFAENFKQIKPLMNETEAYYESSRCLFCYDAPCVTACPTGIDIPLFIRQINTNNAIGAAKTIYDSNTFGYACGKVCPTEVLCEGACVYNHQDVKPIEIGRLQSFATGKAIHSGKKFYKPAKPNGKKVAVIGAGPAGIACAADLRMYGCEVDVFEAKEKPSGLTVYGVAPYKITNEEVLDEMKYLEEQFGYKVHYKQAISDKSQLDKLEKEYDAIFLGIGLGATSSLNIKGEELENCFGAVEFVAKLRMQKHGVKVPAKVIVLGGGNTAMDAASESARMGAESVVLAYRRAHDEMGAYEFEYDLAKSVGVKGVFNVSAVEIIGNGKVEAIKLIRTENVNGQLQEVKGSEFTVPCDWVIKATGQSKQTELLGKIEGLKLDAKGRISVNEKTFQTGNKKYFAAGDAVSGGEEVVNAVADGRRAAKGIIEFLKS